MADFDYDTKINTGASPITLSQSAGSNNDRDADGQTLSRRSVRQSIYNNAGGQPTSDAGDHLSMSVAGIYQNMIKRIDELGWRLHDQIWHPDRMAAGHLYSRRDTPLPSPAMANQTPVRPVPKTVMRAYLRAQATSTASASHANNAPSTTNNDDAIDDWYQEREKLKAILPKLQHLMDHGMTTLSVDPNIGVYASVDRAVENLSLSDAVKNQPESVRAK